MIFGVYRAKSNAVVEAASIGSTTTWMFPFDCYPIIYHNALCDCKSFRTCILGKELACGSIEGLSFLQTPPSFSLCFPAINNSRSEDASMEGEGATSIYQTLVQEDIYNFPANSLAVALEILRM